MPRLRVCASAAIGAAFMFAAATASAGARAVQMDCARPPWIGEGDQTDCRFGTISPAGDVNGDGYADVVIGAYNHSDGQSHEGRIYVYHGGPAGLAAAPDWTFESNQAEAQLGDKLSSAGDVNGDGYDDLIVGAVGYDSTFTDEGRAYLFLGSPAGLASTPAWTAVGGQAGGRFGSCVRGAGDVNGDSYDDVIVGAWLYDTGLLDAGMAFLYLGGPGGLAPTPAWSNGGEAAGAVYGYFVNTAGDLNHDGYDDIVVGSRRFSGNGITREGKVYVYLGSPSGPSLTADWAHAGGLSRGEFGAAVGSAGDVNRDGYDDLLIGAFRQSVPDSAEGRAYVYLGGPTGPATVPAWSAEGNQKNAQFGYHLWGGDINHDGYADVVVSAVSYTVGGLADAGRVYLYEGGPTGLASTPAWSVDGDQAGQRLGDAVSVLGDIDHDGFNDFAAGALYRDNAYVDAGRAYAYYGCADSLTTGVGDEPGPATTPRIEATTPFATATDITFSLPRGEPVRLGITDLQGRSLRRFASENVAAGQHRIHWDGRSDHGQPLPPGVYLVHLRTPTASSTLKVIKLQ